jgi:hypothetical protein
MDIMMRQVAIIRPYCGLVSLQLSAIGVPLCSTVYYTTKEIFFQQQQERAVNTALDHNGDIFCRGVNPDFSFPFDKKSVIY